MTPLRATRYSKSHAFQREPIHCDVGDATDKSWKMLNPMQMRSDFSQQRPIRLFGVVSDSLKMLFPHATTRPLKVMEAYRVAVMGLHRKANANPNPVKLYPELYCEKCGEHECASFRPSVVLTRDQGEGCYVCVCV